MLWSGSTQGVTNDVCPPLGAPYAAENLGHACEAAGKTWRAYSEGLPAIGSTLCTNPATFYLRRHCPEYNGEQYYQYQPCVKGDNLITAHGGAMAEFAVAIAAATGCVEEEKLSQWMELYHYSTDILSETLR